MESRKWQWHIVNPQTLLPCLPHVRCQVQDPSLDFLVSPRILQPGQPLPFSYVSLLCHCDKPACFVRGTSVWYWGCVIWAGASRSGAGPLSSLCCVHTLRAHGVPLIISQQVHFCHLPQAVPARLLPGEVPIVPLSLINLLEDLLWDNANSPLLTTHLPQTVASLVARLPPLCPRWSL
jgi:hypothetical protein